VSDVFESEHQPSLDVSPAPATSADTDELSFLVTIRHTLSGAEFQLLEQTAREALMVHLLSRAGVLAVRDH
jgi:hypothetical protein